MKFLKIGFIIVVLGGLLCACSFQPGANQPTPEYVPEGATRDSITADTDLIVQDLISGIENNDYATFSKHFSDVMLNSLKETDFDALVKQFSALGKSESVELVNVQVAGDYYAVRYKVTYGQKVIIFRIVVDKTDTSVQNGLWFE